MYSLNKNKSQLYEIFTDDVLDFIEREGFKYQKWAHSYCWDLANESTEMIAPDGWAYYRHANGSAYNDISVFIRSDRIEVDVDYSCGGNSSTRIIMFDGDFERAYAEMVKFVMSKQ